MKRQEYWTTGDLAKAAGVTDSYIRRLLLTGKVRGEKHGRDWAIRGDVAVAWLAARKAKRGEAQEDLGL
jgi:hypothetical protein